MAVYQRCGWIGVVLIGMLVGACGAGDSNPAAGDAGRDLASVEIIDTDADAVPSDASAEAADAVADQGPVLPWVPEQPVEASQVFPALTSSEGIAVDDQGRFLLTANDALLRLGQDGTLETLAPIPKAPGMPNVGFAGVAWHPSWGAVIAQTMGNRLYRWTETDGLVLLADPIGKGPNGVLFDGEGHLLVSLSQDADSSVVRLDTPEASPVTLATGIPFANGLALSAAGGTFYVASTSKGAAYQGPRAGEPPYTASELSSDPLLAGADGLLLSPDGWLLVASWSKGRVVAQDLATGALRVVSDTPLANLAHVASLAFGPGGDLDPRCLFVTRLNEVGLARICP